MVGFSPDTDWLTLGAYRRQSLPSQTLSHPWCLCPWYIFLEWGTTCDMVGTNYMSRLVYHKVRIYDRGNLLGIKIDDHRLRPPC